MQSTVKTILVVEDDTNLLLYNEKKLIRGGYQVYTAQTLDQARKVFMQHEIDLIVLDVMLPDGSGVDFCSEVKEKKDVIVLFLSGKVQIEDKITGLNSGGDYYLAKPYDFDELLAVVKSLLRRLGD